MFIIIMQRWEKNNMINDITSQVWAFNFVFTLMVNLFDSYWDYKLNIECCVLSDQLSDYIVKKQSIDLAS